MNKWCSTLRPIIIFVIISCFVLLRTRNVSDKSCRENQDKHFVSGNFFSKILPSWDNVEKYSGIGQATDDSMVHTLCMLDT